MKRLVALTLMTMLIGALTMNCSKDIEEVVGPTEYVTTTVYDTVVQYDSTTTMVYDTTVMVDTIIQYDSTTTIMYDTAIVVDTIIQYDSTTTMVYDTMIMVDTVIQHDSVMTIVYDTTVVIDTVTIYIPTLVYDTTVMYDTTIAIVYDTTVVTDTVIQYDSTTTMVYDTIPYNFDKQMWSFSHYIIQFTFTEMSFDCFSTFTPLCSYAADTPPGRDGFRLVQIDELWIAEGYALSNGQYLNYGVFFTVDPLTSAIEVYDVVIRPVDASGGRLFHCN